MLSLAFLEHRGGAAVLPLHHFCCSSVSTAPLPASLAGPTCRVESMEAQLMQLEERGRDRAVALRTILRDDKQMDQLLAQHGDGELALRVGHVPPLLGGWLYGCLAGQPIPAFKSVL